MTRYSFDVFLSDGSSLTAEPAGPGCWEIFWIDEMGENRVNYGRLMGTRCEAMIKVEKMAELSMWDKIYINRING